jgi:uncharacterized membrane protein (UPF0127 family)
MRIYVKQVIYLILSLSCVLSIQGSHSKEPDLEALEITTSSGETITYEVEIARTLAQMMRGLMFRDTMPENQGMLFIYSPERPATMWMKNTILPLDMLFIDGKGIIVNIARDTVPFSLDRISSGKPVKGVLELNAGQVEKQGIAIGDKATHSIFD